MIEANSTSNTDAKTQKARLAYAQAHEHLENYVLTIVDTSKIKKLSAFYGLIDQAIESLQDYVGASGTVRSEYQIRKPARFAISTLKTLRDDVEAKTTTLKRVQKVSTTKVSGYLQDMVDANTALLNEQEANSLKDAERDFLNTKEAFRKYSKFQRKLPNKLKRPDSFQIAEIPVMARLAGRVGSVSFLKAVNVDYTPVGFEGGSSDIGIVFEKQNLLMFSKTSALEDAETLFDEDANKSGLDGKKLTAAKRDAKKKMRQYYTQMAQSLNITTKDGIKDFVAIQMDMNDKERKGQDLNKLVKKHFAKSKPALQKTIHKELMRLTDEVEKIIENIEKLEKQQKQTKSQYNARRKSQLDEASVLLKYASAAVDEISKQTGHDYVVFSPMSVQNPRNSDIVMFWIVPKVFSRVMTSFSDDGIKVAYWDLPWSKQSKNRKASKAIPKSIELPVRMSRGK